MAKMKVTKMTMKELYWVELARAPNGGDRAFQIHGSNTKGARVTLFLLDLDHYVLEEIARIAIEEIVNQKNAKMRSLANLKVETEQ